MRQVLRIWGRQCLLSVSAAAGFADADGDVEEDEEDEDEDELEDSEDEEEAAAAPEMDRSLELHLGGVLENEFSEVLSKLPDEAFTELFSGEWDGWEGLQLPRGQGSADGRECSSFCPLLVTSRNVGVQEAGSYQLHECVRIVFTCSQSWARC